MVRVNPVRAQEEARRKHDVDERSPESAAFTAKNWRISCSPFRSIDQDINMWCPFLASLAHNWITAAEETFFL